MPTFRVTFLGTGDAFGHGGRLQAATLVETRETRLLVDCGPSVLIAMERFGVDPKAVDAVLLTHLHGDHFGGVPFFLLDARLNRKRTAPLVVSGPEGLEARIGSACEALFPGATGVPWGFPVDFTGLSPGLPWRFRDVTVTAGLAAHPAGGNPSLALRIECAGAVLAFTGDTEWTETLVPVLSGADLAVCEGYTFEKAVKFHLSVATLAGRLPALGVGRAVLVHAGPETLARRADSPFPLAEDGGTVEV